MFGKTKLHLKGNAAVANTVLDTRVVAEVLLNLTSTACFHDQTQKSVITANVTHMVLHALTLTSITMELKFNECIFKVS
jgi:hypothetical protein